MCRENGKVVLCQLIGSEPALWSKRALLEPASWLHQQVDTLSECIKLAAKGDTQAAREKVKKEMLDRALHDWFGQHADHSGRGRALVLGHPKPHPSLYKNGGPPKTLEKEVFKRDGYRCRYCEIRVILPEVLKVFSAVMGKDIFPYGASARERHGATRVYPASPDHVIPKGRLEDPNTEENLVTACWPCQFGKMEFTLEQVGLENPFDRSPISDDWDGLSSLVPQLQLVVARSTAA